MCKRTGARPGDPGSQGRGCARVSFSVKGFCGGREPAQVRGTARAHRGAGKRASDQRLSRRPRAGALSGGCRAAPPAPPAPRREHLGGENHRCPQTPPMDLTRPRTGGQELPSKDSAGMQRAGNDAIARCPRRVTRERPGPTLAVSGPVSRFSLSQVCLVDTGAVVSLVANKRRPISQLVASSTRGR